MSRSDFLVIGAGIAGASAAYRLSEHGSVRILERESTPGYHTTGRSAAVFFDTYGTPLIRRLTRASRPFLESPPDGFAEHPVLTPCGAMYIARDDQIAQLESHYAEIVASGARMERISAEDIVARVPVVRADYAAAGLHEPDAMAMDVNAIHQGYLRGARSRGSQLSTDAEVTAITRAGDAWEVVASGQRYQAGVVVNAAGAWCDQVAALAGIEPVGLVPKRRTAIHVSPPSHISIEGWPLVIDMDEQFYFKSETGRLLCSPADETPMPPCDVQPEDLDIAMLVDRLERATTLQIRRIEHRWAGLRSFVADKGLVIGMEAAAPGFFWLAGQGGYGIQTSPAAGRAAAALIVDGDLPADMCDLGITPASLAPERTRASG